MTIMRPELTTNAKFDTGTGCITEVVQANYMTHDMTSTRFKSELKVLGIFKAPVQGGPARSEEVGVLRISAAIITRSC